MANGIEWDFWNDPSAEGLEKLSPSQVMALGMRIDDGTNYTLDELSLSSREMRRIKKDDDLFLRVDLQIERTGLYRIRPDNVGPLHYKK